MRWAWEQSDISAPAELVLMALADHANDQGACWPSTRRLAEKCNMTRGTLWRHVVTLKAKGLVDVEPRISETGSQTSNLYLLAVSPLPTDETGVPTSHSGGADKWDRGVPKVGTGILNPQLEPPINQRVGRAVVNRPRPSRADLVKLDEERYERG